jgi:hypothetical protein
MISVGYDPLAATATIDASRPPPDAGGLRAKPSTPGERAPRGKAREVPQPVAPDPALEQGERRAALVRTTRAAVGLSLERMRAAADQADPEPEPELEERRSATAAPRVGRVVVDGVLDEETWAAAIVGDGLRQLVPEDGAPASEATRFRVLWDDEAIYVGIECDDHGPPSLRGGMRDDDGDGDTVVVDIDPALDGRTAYHFGVAAAGQQIDGMHTDDTDFDTDWDGAWDSRVRVSERGWTVEMRIPLRIMRVPAKPAAFGFNVTRFLARRNESAYWQYRPAGSGGGVSQFGRLVGVSALQPGSALEVSPYLSTRATHSQPGAAEPAPLRQASCLSGGPAAAWLTSFCAGLDLRFSSAGGLALVAALNPDFGPVQPDLRVQNLSNFEVYRSEKRPFFTQEMDVFESPLTSAWQPFYSRRIGRQLRAPSSADVLESPSVSPVAAALKLTNTAGSTDYGVLATFEPGATALVLDASGDVVQESVAEPFAAAVTRLRHRLGDQAVLGLTATAAERFGQGARAQVGAIDASGWDQGRDWKFALQLGGSKLWDNDRAVVRDGTVLEPGAAGGALSARVKKQGGWLVGALSFDYLTPTFVADDLGYMARANLVDADASFGLRDVRGNDGWRRAGLTLRLHEQHNTSGLLLKRKLAVDGTATLRNTWVAGLSLSNSETAADDRELGDGTPLQRPGGLTISASLDTDARQPASASFSAQQWFGEGEAMGASVSGDVVWRPHSSLETGLGLGVASASGDVRKLRGATGVPEDGADPEESLPRATASQSRRLYLFAPQSSRSVDVRVHAQASILPRLVFQAYVQGFASTLWWGAAKRAVAEPGREIVRLDALQEALPEDLAPDGDEQEFALDVNLVLQWEFQAGSAISLVYAHSSGALGSSTARRLSVGDAVDALRGSAAGHGDVFFIRLDLLANR